MTEQQQRAELMADMVGTARWLADVERQRARRVAEVAALDQEAAEARSEYGELVQLASDELATLTLDDV